MDKFWVAVAVTIIGIGLNVLVKVLDVTPGVKRRFVGISIFLIVVGVGIFGLFVLGMVGLQFRSPIFFKSVDQTQSVTEDASTVVVWGLVNHQEGKPHQLQLIADGRRILSYNPSYQSDYRLALICFHTDGTKDHRDIDKLQKSSLYDIGNGGIRIILTVDDAFVEEWKGGERRTYYFLFLVPKRMEMDQFSTIRQAEAMGVIQIAGRIGPP